MPSFAQNRELQLSFFLAAIVLCLGRPSPVRELPGLVDTIDTL